jgi:hypothetical protein
MAMVRSKAEEPEYKMFENDFECDIIQGTRPVHLTNLVEYAMPKNDISKQFAAPRIIPALKLRATATPMRNPSVKQSMITGTTRP